MLTTLKTALKMLFAPVIFRHYPIGLKEPRFHLWLDALRDTQGVEGSVVEVGIAAGGTSAFSRNYLRYVGDPRPYLCIDTFGGFVDEQFDNDVSLGGTATNRNLFRANSMGLVRKVLKLHGASDIQLLKADICRAKPSDMPAAISACLLDVDLASPIYSGLKLIWPLLSPGGVILVDDCLDGNDWKALDGVKQFSQESGIPFRLVHGGAIFTKPATAQ